MVHLGVEATKLVKEAAGSLISRDRVGSAGANFSSFLATATENALKKIPAAENIAMKGVVGNQAPQQVVLAIMEAERNLQTVIAVRDKVISAYQEITRMQI